MYWRWITLDVRLFNKKKNYKTGRISFFVFCVLSRDKTRPYDKKTSEFCLDFMFCRATKKRDKIENTDLQPIFLRSTNEDRKRQNIKKKQEIRPVLYFVFLLPLGTTQRPKMICPIFFVCQQAHHYSKSHLRRAFMGLQKIRSLQISK